MRFYSYGCLKFEEIVALLTFFKEFISFQRIHLPLLLLSLHPTEFFLARDSYQAQTFRLSKYLQTNFSFPIQSLMGVSRPPCGSGLLRNFVERTVASSSPLYSLRNIYKIGIFREEDVRRE